MSVLRKLADLAVSEREKTISDLLIGAIFYAMRSCEYLRTSQDEEAKRTKILCLRNYVFIKNEK